MTDIPVQDFYTALLEHISMTAEARAAKRQTLEVLISADEVPTREEWPFLPPTEERIALWRSSSSAAMYDAQRAYLVHIRELDLHDEARQQGHYPQEEHIFSASLMLANGSSPNHPLYRTISYRRWEDEQKMSVFTAYGEFILIRTRSTMENGVESTHALQRVNTPQRWRNIILFHHESEPWDLVINA